MIQIQIVTWNSSEHLERLFKGIHAQKGVEYSVVVIDNHSHDKSVQRVRSLHPDAMIIENESNRGFAAAHNQGFEYADAPYILVLNPDTEMQPGFLSSVLATIKGDSSIGSVGGILYRELPDAKKDGIIDSCGLKMMPWGEVVDIHCKPLKKGNFEAHRRVFGISGACVLYRKKALLDVCDLFGVFDERFGTYKEDVDLAWRLSVKGWQSIVCADAACWHERTVRKDNRMSHGNAVRKASFVNHRLMLRKNLSARDWWRIPCILMYETAKSLYMYFSRTRV